MPGRGVRCIVTPPCYGQHGFAVMPIQIHGLDHLVLTVADVDRTREFYRRVLGMDTREYMPGRFSLHFGEQKINLHPADHTVDGNVKHATPGSADLCFLTETALDGVLRHLDACEVKVIEGPVEREGAAGPILSVYIYDPDENLIEIAQRL